jgi:hypothetical protein
VAYVRTVKTSSGATAVQIVWSARRGRGRSSTSVFGPEGAAMAELGPQAVVLGAAIAGLLTARVLSDFYSSVTVVEPLNGTGRTDFGASARRAGRRNQVVACGGHRKSK